MICRHRLHCSDLVLWSGFRTVSVHTLPSTSRLRAAGLNQVCLKLVSLRGVFLRVPLDDHLVKIYEESINSVLVRIALRVEIRSSSDCEHFINTAGRGLVAIETFVTVQQRSLPSKSRVLG